MALPTAALNVNSVELTCPKCEQGIASPTGSLFIAEHEYDAMPSQMTCETCGARFRLPAWPKARAPKARAPKQPTRAEPQLTKALTHLLKE